MPQLRIHQLVDAEFGEALTWYAGLSPLAADNFAACFDAALEKIQQRPMRMRLGALPSDVCARGDFPTC
jgi:hypothetical protein